VRNERCQAEFGCPLVEMFAILAVVTGYQITGRPVLRGSVEKLVSDVEDLLGGGAGATRAMRRGILRDAGRSQTSAVRYVPGPRAFAMFGLPVPEGIR
jgi:hypothetical protein